MHPSHHHPETKLNVNFTPSSVNSKRQQQHPTSRAALTCVGHENYQIIPKVLTFCTSMVNVCRETALAMLVPSGAAESSDFPSRLL